MADAPLTVSALIRSAKGCLEAKFANVWVAGEVSKVSRPASGHIYLTIKDESAAMEAVIYRGVGLRLKFDVVVGMQVLVRGRATFFEARGQFQFAVEELQPKGVGALDLAFRQLKERLEARGYFDPRRKKLLPTFPRTLALVTSPSGAAVRDMLELLGRRWPVATIIVAPTAVQGEGAAIQIAAAIHRLNRHHADGSLCIDAMVVGRGGGSVEDLWAFNEEVVADAIFASTIPVVSAVGHETDVTISDHVADHRALTPSHAIHDLTPDRQELRDALDATALQMTDRLRRRLSLLRQRLESFADRRPFRAPFERLHDHRRKLSDAETRLRRAAAMPVERAGSKLAAIAGRLQSLSPLNVLARGYSLTQAGDGKIILDADAVQTGQVLTTRLAHGRIESQVLRVEKESP